MKSKCEDKYRFVNELNGKIIYEQCFNLEKLSNCEIEERVEKRKNDLSYNKNIPYQNIIVETF